MLKVTTSRYYFCENGMEQNEFFIFQICKAQKTETVFVNCERDFHSWLLSPCRVTLTLNR